MVEPLEPKLITAFAPIVAECLTEFGLGGRARIGITHLGKEGRADVWTLDVPIDGRPSSTDLASLAIALGFCHYKGPPVTVDGTAWHVGHRDHPEAVLFYDNAFHILLRTFV
jgi:hypothetical protein